MGEFCGVNSTSTVATWPTLMIDNKPPFFHRFSRLHIFRGFHLTPKKQTGDCSEHYCLLFVSSRGVCFYCFPSLLCSAGNSGAVFSCRKQEYRQLSYACSQSISAISNPSNCQRVGCDTRPILHYYFSKFKQCLVRWPGCPMKRLPVQQLE